MTQEDDPVFKHPEAYGIEDLEAPGEPKRDELPPSEPVPGTGRQAREEHQRRHDEEALKVPDPEFRDRLEREEKEQARRDLDESDADLTS